VGAAQGLQLGGQRLFQPARAGGEKGIYGHDVFSPLAVQAV